MHNYADTNYFEKIKIDAYDCYNCLKYVAAYFEKEYADILTEYRDGEPGMPDHILRELPPFQINFSEDVISNIISLREEKGMTYSAIGKEMHITKEKVEKLYNHHYHVLYYKLSGKIIEITGDLEFRRKYRAAFQIGSGKKKYDCLVSDYPELCEMLLKTDLPDDFR